VGLAVHRLRVLVEEALAAGAREVALGRALEGVGADRPQLLEQFLLLDHEAELGQGMDGITADVPDLPEEQTLQLALPATLHQPRGVERSFGVAAWHDRAVGRLGDVLLHDPQDLLLRLVRHRRLDLREQAVEGLRVPGQQAQGLGVPATDRLLLLPGQGPGERVPQIPLGEPGAAVVVDLL
jgi:hypothetical protein